MSETHKSPAKSETSVRAMLLAAPEPCKGDSVSPWNDPMHRWYIGALKGWQDFARNVHQFYHSAEMTQALADCDVLQGRKDSYTTPNLENALGNPANAFEHFYEQVIGPCSIAIRAIMRSWGNTSVGNAPSMASHPEYLSWRREGSVERPEPLKYVMRFQDQVRLAGHFVAFANGKRPIPKKPLGDLEDGSLGSMRFLIGKPKLAWCLYPCADKS